MFSRPRLPVLASVGLVIASFLALAAPAAAETVVNGCTGTCGYSQFDDNGPPFGATCKYGTQSYKLDWIKTKPPLVHGIGNKKTEVAWQVKVLRKPVNGGYSVIYTSPWDTAMADNNMNPAYAGHGFAAKTWNAPNNPNGWFKIRVRLRWKNLAGNIVGFKLVEIDHYKGLWNGMSDDRYGYEYCLPSY